MKGLLAVLLAWAPAVTWEDSTGRCPASKAEPHVRDALESDASVEVVATVREAHDGEFVVDLEIREGEASTRRSLRSPACETLVDAAALIASSAAATFEVPLPPEPETTPEPEPEPPSQPASEPAEPALRPASVEPVPGPEPSPRPSGGRRTPPLGVFVRGAAAAGFGLTPRFDLGGSFAAGLSIGEARIETHAVVHAPTSTPGSPRIVAQAWSIGLRGCGGWRPPSVNRVGLLGCGGVEAGELLGSARGEQLIRASNQRSPWLGATLGAGLTLDLGRVVRLVALLDAVFTLRSAPFTIAGSEITHQATLVGPRGLLGVEVHFLGRKTQARGK